MAKRNDDNTVVDFDQVRKKRQRRIAAKRVLVLAGIALLICLIVMANNFLLSGGFALRISDLFGSMGGSGYPVDAPGGVIRSADEVDGKLAVLNDTNLYVYNGRGKQIANFPQMSERTVLLTGGDYMLTYEKNANKYQIHSGSKTLHSVTDMEYPILSAAINEHGDHAIVSSSKQSMCEVNVYDNDAEKQYTYYYANNVVSAAAVSPSGSGMATGWVNAAGGVLVSCVDFFQLDEKEPSASLELSDQFVLRIEYLGERRVAVLTDKAYIITNTSGVIQRRYDFAGRQLLADEHAGNLSLFLLEDTETRRKDLVLLSSDLEEKAVLSAEEEVEDIALSSRRIYVLWGDAIRAYNLKFEQVQEDAVQYVSCIQMAGGKLLYFDRDQIGVFGRSDTEETQGGNVVPLPEELQEQSSTPATDTQTATATAAESAA